MPSALSDGPVGSMRLFWTAIITAWKQVKLWLVDFIMKFTKFGVKLTQLAYYNDVC
jgi:hypothetical protein